MAVYRELTHAGIATRRAAKRTGVSRATAIRAVKPPVDPAPRAVVPANKLSELDSRRVLYLLDRPELVDETPIQVLAVVFGVRSGAVGGSLVETVIDAVKS